MWMQGRRNPNQEACKKFWAVYQDRHLPETRVKVAAIANFELNNWKRFPPAPYVIPWFIMCKHARLLQGSTQRQFAKQFGVSRSSIIRWESGRDFGNFLAHVYQTCFIVVNEHRIWWNRQVEDPPEWSTDHLYGEINEDSVSTDYN